MLQLHGQGVEPRGLLRALVAGTAVTDEGASVATALLVSRRGGDTQKCLQGIPYARCIMLTSTYHSQAPM